MIPNARGPLVLSEGFESKRRMARITRPNDVAAIGKPLHRLGQIVIMLPETGSRE
jgi:hypothetical protein